MLDVPCWLDSVSTYGLEYIEFASYVEFRIFLYTGEFG